jgi:hypothetical protein
MLARRLNRPPGKKLSFFLKNLEKKKLKKSFSTDKFRSNGQIFSMGISPIPPLVVKIRPEYGKNTANTSTDP